MPKNPFLQGQDNLKFLTKADNREYNHYMLNLMGLNSKIVVFLIDIFTPLIYILNISLSICIVIVKYLISLITYRLRVNPSEYADFGELYLFFINHLPDRCKAAKFFDLSKYWIISPDIKNYSVNLDGKVIVNYRRYLTKFDAFKILWWSLSCIAEYIYKYRSLCLIHKAWDYYAVKASLDRIGKNSTLYFSNQSDKWALLFDQVKSQKKVLFQHGIASNWGEVPYKLGSIDEFYSMSDNTWQDAYKNILSCTPHLVVMEPTISLYDIPSDKFNVLIVADIVQLDIERKILAKLNEYNSLSIYLKKHPALENDACYQNLKEQYHFNYITEKKFPKVDFVISYYSTLAYEYMAHGIPVYLYMTKDEYNEDEMISQMMSIKNK